MAVAANEPYKRVSKDNGVFDGAMIGAAVGAGGAGAGIFGARMSYNGIEGKTKRQLQEMDNGLSNLVDQEAKVNKKTNKKLDQISNRKNGRFDNWRIEKPLDNLDKRHQKNMNRINSEAEKLATEFEKVSQPSYLDDRKAGHAYKKMGGGLKKAGIIGASAVVAGGVGMIADGIHE